MILNFVSGCECYKTLMYPVNVYSFTTAAPLQTYCTLGAYQENSHRKVALKTSPQHHLTKQQRHIGHSEAHPSSNIIFEASRWISLAFKGHESNSWLSHLQSPIHKRAPGGNIRAPTSLCNYILVISTSVRIL